MGEVIFLGLLAVISVVFFVMTFSFPTSIMDKSGGPAIFPQIVLVFLFVLVLIRIVMVLRQKERPPFVFLELFKGMRLFFFLSLVCYIVAIDFLGYILSSILFFAVTVNFFYYKAKGTWGSVKSIALRNGLILVFVFSLNAFFSGILKVMLPPGIWG